jgi:hypothetical protein
MPVTTRSSVAGNVGWDHCKKGNIACVYSYLASNRLVLEGGPRLQLYPPLKCRSLRDSYHSWLSGVVNPQWALVHWERSEGWYSLLSGRAIAEAVPIQTHVLPLLRVYNDVSNFGTAITGQETRAPGCDSVRRFSWAAPSIGGVDCPICGLVQRAPAPAIELVALVLAGFIYLEVSRGAMQWSEVPLEKLSSVPPDAPLSGRLRATPGLAMKLPYKLAFPSPFSEDDEFRLCRCGGVGPRAHCDAVIFNLIFFYLFFFSPRNLQFINN